MPYLNLGDKEDFTHLIQLYQAAHPDYRAKNEALRDAAGLEEGEYWISLAMAQDLAAWAMARHLITRASAQHLVETMTQLHAAGLKERP